MHTAAFLGMIFSAVWFSPNERLWPIIALASFIILACAYKLADLPGEKRVTMGLSLLLILFVVAIVAAVYEQPKVFVGALAVTVLFSLVSLANAIVTLGREIIDPPRIDEEKFQDYARRFNQKKLERAARRNKGGL